MAILVFKNILEIKELFYDSHRGFLEFDPHQKEA